MKQQICWNKLKDDWEKGKVIKDKWNHFKNKCYRRRMKMYFDALYQQAHKDAKEKTIKEAKEAREQLEI